VLQHMQEQQQQQQCCRLCRSSSISSGRWGGGGVGSQDAVSEHGSGDGSTRVRQKCMWEACRRGGMRSVWG
jgi:hypothetical protein